MKRSIFAAALALASLSSAYAASTITGLANTGVGASGDGDANYKITAYTSDTTLTTAIPTITVGTEWPINPWMANTDISKWITPTALQSQTFDASANGSYTYTLQFSLTGYNPTTASFVGQFAADNDAIVKLNGAQIATGTGFGGWTPFSASTGFVSGTNTLEFVVGNWAQNGGNPTGLRVEFNTSSVTAVPEPDTYAMLLAGGALLGVVARRKARKQA